jgi:ABC-type Zn uptake system ZnuABC Zn-binding protein ZnuA
MRAAALAGGALLLAATVAAGAPLRVVATIQPLAMIAREVGGARIEVSVLVPPGASPHTFEPQPGDLARLADAVLLLEAGAGLDAWVRRLALAVARRPAAFVLIDAPGLDPLPAAGGHADTGERRDPHAWLDPIRVREAVVPALAARLAELDPEGRADYERAAREAGERLGALDAEVRATLSGRGRHFVAFHAAWRYFAARYGLEEVGVVEEAPGEEPTPRELARLVARARAARVPAILVEPQLSPRVAEALASELGARIVRVDPNGDPTDPERDTYPELMRWNARAFASALGDAP